MDILCSTSYIEISSLGTFTPTVFELAQVLRDLITSNSIARMRH